MNEWRYTYTSHLYLLTLDDLKEKGRDWKLKQKVLNDTLWKTRLGIVYGPVARLVVLQKQYAVNMH